MKIRIKGGRVIDPGLIDEIMDIVVKDGKIAGLESQEARAGDDDHVTVIDASDKIITPGLIDMHVHFREPGHEYKETIETGCHAAAAGGFTSVCTMPNTLPVNDNRQITEFILEKASRRFGSQCIVVAVDAKRAAVSGDYSGEPISWEVFIYGGRKPTGINAIEWARRVESCGAGEILLTSMDRDGTKDGYDLEITRAVSEAVEIPVIASGGAGNFEHFYQAFTTGEADAALAASVFHYKEFTIEETKSYLKGKGVEVRLL